MYFTISPCGCPRAAQATRIENRKLLDDFIRSGQHVGRNRFANLLCSLEIYDELKLYRLLHRQIGRLCSLQGFCDSLLLAPCSMLSYDLIRPRQHVGRNR